MENNKVTLKELIGDTYKPEVYFSDAEEDLIRRTFAGNNELFRVLRKVFMPTALDPELPIEEMSKDAWLIDKDFSMMQGEEVKATVLARQDSIKFVLGGLVKLKIMAHTKRDETPDQKEARRKADSTK